MSYLSFRIKPIIAESIGATVSGAGAVTAWQQQFDYWFRQFGTLVAVIAGLATIWTIIRKGRRRRPTLSLD